MHSKMQELASRLESLLDQGQKYFTETDILEISNKPNPEKWSKKEILGHLIDSGINNLQRFTEIPFSSTPYKLRTYNQDALVKTNDYQNTPINEIVELWMALNKRIQFLIKRQTEEALASKIEYPNEGIIDLNFLMCDYVDHLEHHLNQIMEY